MHEHVESGTEARAASLTKMIAVLVIAALSTFGWQTVSSASPAVLPTGQTMRADSHFTEMCLMPKPVADAPICPGAAKKKARQFRKHKLGNAKGITIPKFMQKRIKRKWRRMHGRQQADGCCDWITDPLKSTACLVTNPVGTHRGVCDEGQRSVNRIMRSTDRVLLYCGAAAVIGYQKGGGWWGAGSGGGLCMWSMFLDSWYK